MSDCKTPDVRKSHRKKRSTECNIARIMDVTSKGLQEFKEVTKRQPR